MHVLRAEKGFIIVGQDTDGSMTPSDLNHDWAVANKKPFSFIGKRGMNREDCLRDNRKQLVVSMVGHVTSSYYSAFLDRRIAMAVIKDGLQRMGEKVYFPMADGSVIEAEICSTVFLDADNLRQKA